MGIELSEHEKQIADAAYWEERTKPVHYSACVHAACAAVLAHAQHDAPEQGRAIEAPSGDAAAKDLPRLVVCAVIIRDGMVLLERRAPSGVVGLDNMWDLPGGKVECGEEVEEALIREMAEELSIGIRPTKMIPYLPTSTWVYADGQRRHWILAPYECEIISGEPVCSEKLQWFPLNALPADILQADKRILALAHRHPVRKESSEILAVVPVEVCGASICWFKSSPTPQELPVKS